MVTSVLYFQFVPPPAPPLNLAGPIFVAWFLLGIVIVLVLRVRAPKGWQPATAFMSNQKSE